MAGDTVTPFEDQIVGPDGGITDVEVAMARDATGDAVIWTLREISERKRADASLRESEERLTLAFAGAQEGVWDWNLETGDVVYSPRWKQMLGYADDEIEPHVSAWERLLHPDDMRTRAGGQRERRAGCARPTRASSGSGTRTATTSRSSRAATRSGASPADRSCASSARTSTSPSGSRRKPSGRERNCSPASSSHRKTNGGASRARCTISSASSSLPSAAASARSRTRPQTRRTSPAWSMRSRRSRSRLDRDVDQLVWELRPTALDDLGLRAALANYVQDWSTARRHPRRAPHLRPPRRSARLRSGNDALPHRAGSADQRRQARAGDARRRHPRAAGRLGPPHRRGRRRGVRSRRATARPAAGSGCSACRSARRSSAPRSRSNRPPARARRSFSGWLPPPATGPRTTMAEPHAVPHPPGRRPRDGPARAAAPHRRSAGHEGHRRGERRRDGDPARPRCSSPTSS